MDKKRNIIKYVILFSFAFCLLCLTGCNNSNNNIFSILEANINKIELTLNNVQTIDVSDLIIDDFMNENELYEIDSKYIEFNSNSHYLNDYISKLSILNNNVYSTIKINDDIASAKIEILNKCAKIKQLLKSRDCAIVSSNANSALKEINKNLMENNTKVSLTRNEINNYLSSVKNLKEQYNKKTDQLSSRYVKLQGALNTRNTYYNNMLFNLDQIEYILYEICNDKTNTNNDKNIKETWLNKNIDTYENAGNNLFGFPNGQNFYPYNNYYGYSPNTYGIGMYNGYGNMFGGYGMGIPPYSYGFGYRMPNINTYGGYRNIDSYRNFRKKEYSKQEHLEQDLNMPSNNLSEQIELNENTDVLISSEVYNNNYDNLIIPKRMPKPIPLDKNRNKK